MNKQKNVETVSSKDSVLKAKTIVKKEIVNKDDFVSFAQTILEANKDVVNQPLSKDLDFCFIFASIYLGNNTIEKTTKDNTITYNLTSFDNTSNFIVVKEKDFLSFNLKSNSTCIFYFSKYTFKNLFCEREADIRYFPLDKEMIYHEVSRLNAFNGIYTTEIDDEIYNTKFTAILSDDIFRNTRVIYSYNIDDIKEEFRKASSEFKEIPYIEPFGAKTLMEMLSEHYNEFSDMMMFEEKDYFNSLYRAGIEEYEDTKDISKKLIEKKKENERLKKIEEEKLKKQKIEEENRKKLNEENIARELAYTVDKKFNSKKKIIKKTENN